MHVSVSEKKMLMFLFAAPTVPTGFKCKNRLDTVITLEWQDPEYPNGDLKQYKIKVYINTQPKVLNKTELTGKPLIEFDVTDLEPGTCQTKIKIKIIYEWAFQKDKTSN